MKLTQEQVAANRRVGLPAYRLFFKTDKEVPPTLEDLETWCKVCLKGEGR